MVEAGGIRVEIQVAARDANTRMLVSHMGKRHKWIASDVSINRHLSCVASLILRHLGIEANHQVILYPDGNIHSHLLNTPISWGPSFDRSVPLADVHKIFGAPSKMHFLYHLITPEAFSPPSKILHSANLRHVDIIEDSGREQPLQPRQLSFLQDSVRPQQQLISWQQLAGQAQHSAQAFSTQQQQQQQLPACSVPGTWQHQQQDCSLQLFGGQQHQLCQPLVTARQQMPLQQLQMNMQSSHVVAGQQLYVACTDSAGKGGAFPLSTTHPLPAVSTAQLPAVQEPAGWNHQQLILQQPSFPIGQQQQQMQQRPPVSSAISQSGMPGQQHSGHSFRQQRSNWASTGPLQQQQLFGSHHVAAPHTIEERTQLQSGLDQHQHSLGQQQGQGMLSTLQAQQQPQQEVRQSFATSQYVQQQQHQGAASLTVAHQVAAGIPTAPAVSQPPGQSITAIPCFSHQSSQYSSGAGLQQQQQQTTPQNMRVQMLPGGLGQQEHMCVGVDNVEHQPAVLQQPQPLSPVLHQQPHTQQQHSSSREFPAAIASAPLALQPKESCEPIVSVPLNAQAAVDCQPLSSQPTGAMLTQGQSSMHRQQQAAMQQQHSLHAQPKLTALEQQPTACAATIGPAAPAAATMRLSLTTADGQSIELPLTCSTENGRLVLIPKAGVNADHHSNGISSMPAPAAQLLALLAGGSINIPAGEQDRAVGFGASHAAEAVPMVLRAESFPPQQQQQTVGVCGKPSAAVIDTQQQQHEQSAGYGLDQEQPFHLQQQYERLQAAEQQQQQQQQQSVQRRLSEPHQRQAYPGQEQSSGQPINEQQQLHVQLQAQQQATYSQSAQQRQQQQLPGVDSYPVSAAAAAAAPEAALSLSAAAAASSGLVSNSAVQSSAAARIPHNLCHNSPATVMNGVAASPADARSHCSSVSYGADADGGHLPASRLGGGAGDGNMPLQSLPDVGGSATRSSVPRRDAEQEKSGTAGDDAPQQQQLAGRGVLQPRQLQMQQQQPPQEQSSAASQQQQQRMQWRPQLHSIVEQQEASSQGGTPAAAAVSGGAAVDAVAAQAGCNQGLGTDDGDVGQDLQSGQQVYAEGDAADGGQNSGFNHGDDDGYADMQPPDQQEVEAAGVHAGGTAPTVDGYQHPGADSHRCSQGLADCGGEDLLQLQLSEQVQRDQQQQQPTVYQQEQQQYSQQHSQQQHSQGQSQVCSQAQADSAHTQADEGHSQQQQNSSQHQQQQQQQDNAAAATGSAKKTTRALKRPSAPAKYSGQACNGIGLATFVQPPNKRHAGNRPRRTSAAQLARLPGAVRLPAEDMLLMPSIISRGSSFAGTWHGSIGCWDGRTEQTPLKPDDVTGGSVFSVTELMKQRQQQQRRQRTQSSNGRSRHDGLVGGQNAKQCSTSTSGLQQQYAIPVAALQQQPQQSEQLHRMQQFEAQHSPTSNPGSTSLQGWCGTAAAAAAISSGRACSKSAGGGCETAAAEVHNTEGGIFGQQDSGQDQVDQTIGMVNGDAVVVVCQRQECPSTPATSDQQHAEQPVLQQQQQEQVQQKEICSAEVPSWDGFQAAQPAQGGEQGITPETIAADSTQADQQQQACDAAAAAAVTAGLAAAVGAGNNSMFIDYEGLAELINGQSLLDVQQANQQGALLQQQQQQPGDVNAAENAGITMHGALKAAGIIPPSPEPTAPTSRTAAAAVVLPISDGPLLDQQQQKPQQQQNGACCPLAEPDDAAYGDDGLLLSANDYGCGAAAGQAALAADHVQDHHMHHMPSTPAVGATDDNIPPSVMLDMRQSAAGAVDTSAAESDGFSAGCGPGTSSDQQHTSLQNNNGSTGSSKRQRISKPKPAAKCRAPLPTVEEAVYSGTTPKSKPAASKMTSKVPLPPITALPAVTGNGTSGVRSGLAKALCNFVQTKRPGSAAKTAAAAGVGGRGGGGNGGGLQRFTLPNGQAVYVAGAKPGAAAATRNTMRPGHVPLQQQQQTVQSAQPGLDAQQAAQYQLLLQQQQQLLQQQALQAALLQQQAEAQDQGRTTAAADGPAVDAAVVPAPRGVPSAAELAAALNSMSSGLPVAPVVTGSASGLITPGFLSPTGLLSPTAGGGGGVAGGGVAGGGVAGGTGGTGGVTLDSLEALLADRDLGFFSPEKGNALAAMTNTNSLAGMLSCFNSPSFQNFQFSPLPAAKGNSRPPSAVQHSKLQQQQQQQQQQQLTAGVADGAGTAAPAVDDGGNASTDLQTIFQSFRGNGCAACDGAAAGDELTAVAAEQTCGDQQQQRVIAGDGNVDELYQYLLGSGGDSWIVPPGTAGNTAAVSALASTAGGADAAGLNLGCTDAGDKPKVAAVGNDSRCGTKRQGTLQSSASAEAATRDGGAKGGKAANAKSKKSGTAARKAGNRRVSNAGQQQGRQSGGVAAGAAAGHKGQAPEGFNPDKPFAALFPISS